MSDEDHDDAPPPPPPPPEPEPYPKQAYPPLELDELSESERGRRGRALNDE
jgi:hypothetical protein